MPETDARGAGDVDELRDLPLRGRKKGGQQEGQTNHRNGNQTTFWWDHEIETKLNDGDYHVHIRVSMVTQCSNPKFRVPPLGGLRHKRVMTAKGGTLNSIRPKEKGYMGCPMYPFDATPWKLITN